MRRSATDRGHDHPLSTSAGAVLVIENGQLDLNGHNLTGNALTIVFSGANSASYSHIPTGSGILDIAAPTTGTWSGVAIYQNPALTTNVDIKYTGNSPSWNLTGLVYLPHSSFTLAGAVVTSTSGARCFVIVVDNMTINATGSIFNNNTQCAPAGLNQVGGGYRGTPGELMRSNFRGRLARFRRDARGSVSIEFGFVGLIFITGVLNAFELGSFAYQRMQVENAAYAGAQAAWKTCYDSSLMLPATPNQNQNCPALNTAVTRAIQGTSLGTKVSLDSTGITEGYYCVNASGALQSVGSISSKPANCSAAGNASALPGDYIQVNVTFNYTPFLPMTVMGVHGASTITKTSWMRLG